MSEKSLIERREFLIGGLCAVSAAGAYAATPRTQMSLIGKLKLEDEIPKAFTGWKHYDSGQIVTPESDNSLASKLYSQSVGRIYARADGEFVMMLLAYGNTQSDTLQLHRPEVCYPAFGFEIRDNRPAQFLADGDTGLPGRDLIAANSERTEYISYWTRVGNALPTTGGEQRAVKLRSQVTGVIPDGVLSRFSTMGENEAASFALNKAFARDLLNAVSPPVRRALVGEPLARHLATKGA